MGRFAFRVSRFAFPKTIVETQDFASLPADIRQTLPKRQTDKVEPAVDIPSREKPLAKRLYFPLRKFRCKGQCAILRGDDLWLRHTAS